MRRCYFYANVGQNRWAKRSQPIIDAGLTDRGNSAEEGGS